MASNIANEIAAKVSSLPLEKQREALQIIESLVKSEKQDATAQVPRRRLMGDLEHLNVHLTEDDIHEARREMWRGYMREDSE